MNYFYKLLSFSKEDAFGSNELLGEISFDLTKFYKETISKAQLEVRIHFMIFFMFKFRFFTLFKQLHLLRLNSKVFVQAIKKNDFVA